MSGPFLLVTFCNQLESPQCSGAVVDLNGDGCRWLPLAELAIPNPGNGGLCGACWVADDLVLATQSTPPRLARFSLQTGRFTASRVLPCCNDLHSIVHYEGSLYVVSTGTNEIYEVPLDNDGFGEPRLHWSYPGVAHDHDVVHLNGLTASSDGLIASCFGPRQADGSWGSNGAVFRLEPFEVIRGGLSHPHTPLCYGHQLFFSESRNHRVYAMQRIPGGGWRENPPFDVGGYARGLVYQAQDGSLLVGVSAERQVSRSKATANPVSDTTGAATIVCIDLASRRITSRRKLAGFGEEIYDLLPLSEAGSLNHPADALAQRILHMQAVAAEIRVDYAATIRSHKDMTEMHDAEAAQASSLRAQVEKLTQDLLAERAQAEAACAQVEKLENQLGTVLGSRLWRAAQFLRRLAGRPAWVPDITRPASLTLAMEATTKTRPMAETFREIYVNNAWGSDDSRSGTGSDLTQTAVVREVLPGILRELGVRSMLDVPCGDFHWMRMLDLDVDYIGADVVPDLIAANNAHYASDRRRFQVVDISNDDLPRVDLVFCRDLLVHFSFSDARRAIANLKRSGSTYLLTTTFADRTTNADIETGQWRPLNLQLAPFDFPPALRLVNEKCTEWGDAWADKSLALWKLADL